MNNQSLKEVKRKFRHLRIRKKIAGTSDYPRLCVHRSLKNLSAQVVDDDTGKVLWGVTTLSKSIKGNLEFGGNVDAAKKLGELFADVAKNKGVTRVRFDRGGYLYHGRVKAFAEAVRNGGVEF
jgi:large subunit ribosomal protein L18